MNLNVQLKNKKEIIISTVVGMVLILALSGAFFFHGKMSVTADSVADIIADVKSNVVSAAQAQGYVCNIPVSAEELEETGKTQFTIDNQYDWMALMALSYETNLEGYTFFIERGCDLSGIKVAERPFMGISLNKDNPFKGSLISKLGGEENIIKIKYPLFGYLDASARINQYTGEERAFTLQLEEASSGLAQVLTGSGTITDNDIKNVYLRGSIANEEGCAGGVFGEIIGTDSEHPLSIESLEIYSALSQVSGIQAGGFAGKVSGNVSLTIYDEFWNDSMTVKNVDGEDACVGNVIGRITQAAGNESQKVTISFPENIKISNSVTAAYGCAGGVFGSVEYASIELAGNVTLKKNTGDWKVQCGSVATGFNCGGFAGYMKQVQMAVNTANTITIQTTLQGNCAGGFVGKIEQCNLELKTVSLDCESIGGTHIGGFAGASLNSDNITIGSLHISGGRTLTGIAENVGGVLGKDTGSVYTITELAFEESFTLLSSANATNIGGFAGYLGDTQLDVTNGITIQNHTLQATGTSNTEAKTVFVGGVVGQYDVSGNRELSNVSVSEVQLLCDAANNDSYVGGIVGGIQSSENGCLTVASCGALKLHPKGNTGKMYMGGIVGGNFSDNTIIEDVQASYTQNSQSVIWLTAGLGGIMGYAGADCNISNVHDVLVSPSSPANANYTKAQYVGGVVARAGSEIEISVTDVTFASGNNYLTNYYSGGWPMGGIVGKIGDQSVLALNGNIDLTNLKRTPYGNCASYYGAIVGEQGKSLIYINPISYTNGKYVYGLTVPTARFEDEVGNYGSVYRNGNLDGTPDADLSDTDEWVIQENAQGRTFVKADTDPYTLATAGDCMRLAIALNSENAFTGFGDITCATLLSSKDYKLTASIDLTNTGIQTLNKNYKDIKSEYMFTGRIEGTGSKPVITNSLSVSQQANLGLLSAVGDGAEFENIKVVFSAKYYYRENGDNVCCAYNLLGRHHAGGLAAYAEGSVSLKNVAVETTILPERCFTVQSMDLKERYMGGVFGQYVAKNGKSLTAAQVDIHVNIRLSEDSHYAGGLAGYVKTDDLSADTASITAEDVTIGGTLESIYVKKRTDDNDTYIDTAKMGGLFASIGKHSLAHASAVEKKITVTLDNITVNGLQLADNLSDDAARTLDCGGLLGYHWKNVKVSGDGIHVNAADSVSSGIIVDNHTKGAVYGGLWNTVDGQMSLKNVNLNAMQLQVSGSNTNKNGLLVGNGQYMYLELDGYSIDKDDVQWEDSSAQYRDEIVGYNKGTTGNTADNSGGVVSIVDATAYQLYDNKIIAQSNPNTRYYYNVREDLGEVESLSNNTITISNSAQMLQWSLAHYVNKPLRPFFNISEAYKNSGESVTFTGNIDLGDISYYPVTVAGGVYNGSDSVITFHGEDFDETAADKKQTVADKILYTYQPKSEHYQLQSGVFYDVTTSTLKNFTLKGSVTAVRLGDAMYSGALVAGSINGVKLANQPGNEYISYESTPTYIQNIVLNNIKVSHVASDGWNSYYGLMISRIGSGAVVQIGHRDIAAGESVKGVTMTEYTSSEKVAAALIGRVGNSEAQGINLSFYNMQVADVADSVTNRDAVGKETAAELAGAQVLAHASFIYDYCYQLDNTTGVYIFYKDDYQDGNVTLGYEIGDTVQFYDDNIVASIKSYTAIDENQCLAFDENHYKPYVYTTQELDVKKEIDVNPKTGNITEGSGTYDDPYVIKNASQLVSLYMYLKNYDTYEKNLRGWEVNAFGKDSINGEDVVVQERQNVRKYYNVGIRKDADNEETESASTYDSLIMDDFPSVEQLNNAYYLITSDIDLTDVTDFTGFGMDTRPFTGVFVGRKTVDGVEVNEQCQILMPKTATSGGEATYGFVKYAKGVVLQNLHIVLGNEGKSVQISGTGSGAIAVVLGGDNVLDNVTVSGKLNTGWYSIAGGYVGDLQMGSVILRGITSHSLENFEISRASGTGDGVGAYQNVIIGKIQDGFAIDDDNTFQNYVNRESMNATDTMNVKDVNGSSGLTIRDSIVSLDKDDTIGVTQDAISGYHYSMDTAQDILVLSLTLNSGAMTYKGNTQYAYQYGYDVHARCRNADYSYVGRLDASDEDYAKAKVQYYKVIKYDNCNTYKNGEIDSVICSGATYGTSFYHPYIFQYYDFASNVEILTGVIRSSISANNRMITDPEREAKYISTYQLEPGVYDMSALNIKKCFKGIGAKKNTMQYCLQGNFIGAGSNVLTENPDETNTTTIKLDLDIEKYRDAGLFTTLFSGTTNTCHTYEIGRFNLTGNVSNTHNNGYVAAGGISVLVFGSYDFKDIELHDMTIKSLNEHTAGVKPYNEAAGFIVRGDNLTNDIQNNHINFTDCCIKNANIQALHECGGYVAENATNGKGHVWTRCDLADSTVQTVYGVAGGFIGSVNYDVKFRQCNVYSSTITTKEESCGGFVGAANVGAAFDSCNIKVSDSETNRITKVSIEPYAVIRNKHCGGFAGLLDGTTESSFQNCNIEGLFLKQCTLGNSGGFAAKVLPGVLINTEEGSESLVQNVSVEKYFGDSNGAIIGSIASSSQELVSEINNVTVKGLDIMLSWETYTDVGGIIGSVYEETDLNNVQLIGTSSQPVNIHFRVRAFADSTLRTSVGGMIGFVGGNSQNLSNCSVISQNDDGSETEQCYVKLKNGQWAGGLIGYQTSGKTTVINQGVVKNVFMKASNHSGKPSNLPHGAGGGMVGINVSGILSLNQSTVRNLSMINYNDEVTEENDDDKDSSGLTELDKTKGKTMAYGGLVGASMGNATIQGFDITNLDIGTDGYAGEAGGVMGIVIGSKLVIEKGTGDVSGASITDSYVISGVSGGLLGNVMKNGSADPLVDISDVEIQGTTVMARYLGSNTWETFAGGISGRHEETQYINKYKNINLKNCVITAYPYAANADGGLKRTYLGGMFGGQINSESKCYNVVMEDVLIGYLKYENASKTVLPSFETVKNGTVKLYASKCSYGSSLGIVQEELTPGKCYASKEYMLNAGTVIGYCSKVEDSYVIKAGIRYSEGLAQYHPAVDVGISVTNMTTLLEDESGTVNDGYKYYRDIFHILYRDNFTGNVTTGFLGEKLSLLDYYFDNLDEVYESRFAGQSVDANDDYRLEENYMQNDVAGTNHSVENVLNAAYRTVEGENITYLSPYTDQDGNAIPMLTASGNYDINTVINTAVNVLTNNGGATNKLPEKCLSVSIQRMQIAEDKSSVTEIADGKEVIQYADGVFSLGEEEYDLAEERTFNLITIKYKYSDEDVYTLQIPVYVREMLKIETHMKGMEGTHYLVREIPGSDTEPVNGYTQINVELQSAYTIYSEFIYSSAREDYEQVKLSKSLYRTYDGSSNSIPFDIGTKITLLDITNNNQAYYYEVTEENYNRNSGKILFTDFKTGDGSSYKDNDVGADSITNGSYPSLETYLDICNRAGQEKTEVGLEQFLIIVDETMVSNTTNTIYNLFVRAEEENNVELFKNATCTENCYLKVNAIPGLHKALSGSEKYLLHQSGYSSKFTDGKSETALSKESQISKDGMLNLTGSIYIVSPKTLDEGAPDYWGYVSESNRDAYLEVALSLIRAEDNVRIPVPEGTRITVKMNDASYGDYYANNTEYFYCYNDNLKGSSNDTAYLNIKNLGQDSLVNFEVGFDFSTATDFSDISDTNYYLQVELLETTDKQYPRSGEREDLVDTKLVQGINKKYLGFALETDDMLTMGMNAYNSETSDSGRIGFSSRLDFSDYMDSEDGMNQLTSEFSGKYFTYTYVIERKNTSGEYASFAYTESNRMNSLIRILNGNVPMEDAPAVGTGDHRVIVSRTVQYVVDKTGENQEAISMDNKVMEEDFTLLAEVQELMKTPKYITNYKVTCYVTVTEEEPTEVLTEEELQSVSVAKDFFIFTTAKLKTDLD